MAVTNHERVGKALELLRRGLGPFAAREFDNLYKDRAPAEVLRFLGDERTIAKKPVADWDAGALLKLLWDAWNDVFRRVLGPAERSLVSELREVRNRWAHQEAFSSDDAYRALDSAARLLSAVSSPEAAEIEKMKTELLRLRFDEQVRNEKRKSFRAAVETTAAAGVPPWREVVTPHPDVASGRYQQAEFAADLWQVHLGEGPDEYRDPAEFFRRTYLTESLKRLLLGAADRLSGKGGDPVVHLQTNFGGGKTHSLLALYHLFSGAAPADLPGVDELLAEAGVTSLPGVKRVVIVGNRISPGNPSKKPDGTVVRTLWGELAWQLGRKRAFARIQADDERATSPGDVLRELLKEHGPCLILIDEWVAYARQLHDEGDLPGGSFETQFTFAQALTESAKLAGNCLLVISLPASETTGSPHRQAEDVEVGGLRGREALDRLRNVIGRIESPWRPATAEESFEIVRRRLFEPMADPEKFKQRDLVARRFSDLYRSHREEFPPECGEADYEKRLKAAYPIHPEVFDRLYEDWSTLARFQRTRGVLRLMAAVIHSLWAGGDRNPLILPSSIPIDDPRVQFELTRYLSENWVPVIEKDVDGPDAAPVRLDGEVPNFGKLHACRRVARTIYLGSAPTLTAAHRGIEDRRVKLGCVLLDESPAIFGDALRRLPVVCTYLYQDGPRYWYSTQPTVAKLAEDRAEQLKRNPDKVLEELERRIRADVRNRGDFARVHALPKSAADVPDEREARLVVLGSEHTYAKEPDSPAEKAARELLESRGTGPRCYKNALVFLAPDRARLQDLDDALRRYLAWESILADKETLNLDPHQVRQAEGQKKHAEDSVLARLPETYQWLLVPTQEKPGAARTEQSFKGATEGPGGGVSLEPIRLTGQEPLAVRVSQRLKRDELLITDLAPSRLRLELDGVPLWRGNHVEIRQLAEDFARYVYLPRLVGPAVLAKAVREGIALTTWELDSFAYAEGFDEASKRYRGIRVAEAVSIPQDCETEALLVRPSAARPQLDFEARLAAGGGVCASPTEVAGAPGTAADDRVPGKPAEVRKLRRFHGSVALDPNRVGRDAGRIAEEVIAHLVALPGAEVRITLELDARIPGGAPDQVVRTVTENCRTLKFDPAGFEED